MPQPFSTPTSGADAPHPATGPRPPGQRSGEGAASVLPPLQEDASLRPQPHALPPASNDDSAADQARRVGRFLVSPLVRRSGDGWFAASVSIRSGSGSATTDRVLRLTRLFESTSDAVAYAHAEALQWIRAGLRSPQACA